MRGSNGDLSMRGISGARPRSNGQEYFLYGIKVNIILFRTQEYDNIYDLQARHDVSKPGIKQNTV